MKTSSMKKTLLTLLMLYPIWSNAELPLQVQADLLKHELVTAIKNGDHYTVLENIEKMRRKGIDTGNEVYFYEAQAYFATGNNPAGDVALENYVKKAGNQGANYRTAIAILSDRVAKREHEQKLADEAARIAAEEKRQEELFINSLKPIGKVTSVNTDWGFAKADLTVSTIPENSFLYILLADDVVPVQAGKLTNGVLTIIGVGQKQIPASAPLLAGTMAMPPHLLMPEESTAKQPAAAHSPVVQTNDTDAEMICAQKIAYEKARGAQVTSTSGSLEETMSARIPECKNFR